MSWDGYIDNLIAHTKDASGSAHCDKACIFGLDGGAFWTTLTHVNAFTLSLTESKTIAECFELHKFGSFEAGGIIAGGEKYQFLRRDEKTVIGKKKGHGALTIQASKSAIVVGHCPEGGQQGYLNKGVGAITEHLISMGM